MAPLTLSFRSLSRRFSERKRLSKTAPSSTGPSITAPAPSALPNVESMHSEKPGHDMVTSTGPPTPSLISHVDEINYAPPLNSPCDLPDPFRSPDLKPRYDLDSRAPSILLGYDEITPLPSRPASAYSSPRSSQLDLSVSDENLPLYVGKPPRPSIWTRFVNGFQRQFDWRGFLQLLDVRPWFWPFTWKKYFVLFLLACIIAGIVVSDHFTNWLETSLRITRSYMLSVLIISVCAEPLIIMVALPVAQMPDIPAEEVRANLQLAPNDEASEQPRLPHSGPFETAMVFPCHDTDFRVMKTTIDSCLPHFRPQDIFIVDNGRSKYPTHPEGNFRAYIRSLHPEINYMWSPIGSKNAAQFVGALAAREKGYKYVMTADDDVCMPKNFTAPTDLLDETFVAVAYPIKAMDAKCVSSLWVTAWQDVEYRLSGLAKLAEDRLCGVQFPHGAGWFVEINALIELLEKYHPMDFIAEDCRAGLGISKMGKGIRLDARCFLATEVPSTLFGPGLNWWKQRQKSWEMGRHGLLFAYIKQLLFSLPPKKTVQGILWHKMSFMYSICCILIDWLRIPTIVALGRTGEWWRNAILLMLFSAIPPMAYNYWKCRRRRDMRAPFWAGLTYPLYKQLYTLVSIAGAIRWAGYYLGGHQRSKPIKQMLKEEDWRCFWLDPRFKENPAYLADDAEAIAATVSMTEKMPVPTVPTPVGGVTPMSECRDPFGDENVISRPPRSPDRIYCASPGARSSTSLSPSEKEHGP